MKRIIIVAIVIAAIAGVIAVKRTKKPSPSGSDSGLCPCKLLEAAQTNQTDAGTSTVE